MIDFLLFWAIIVGIFWFFGLLGVIVADENGFKEKVDEYRFAFIFPLIIPALPFFFIYGLICSVPSLWLKLKLLVGIKG